MTRHWQRTRQSLTSKKAGTTVVTAGGHKQLKPAISGGHQKGGHGADKHIGTLVYTPVVAPGSAACPARSTWGELCGVRNKLTASVKAPRQLERMITARNALLANTCLRPCLSTCRGVELPSAHPASPNASSKPLRVHGGRPHSLCPASRVPILQARPGLQGLRDSYVCWLGVTERFSELGVWTTRGRWGARVARKHEYTRSNHPHRRSCAQAVASTQTHPAKSRSSFPWRYRQIKRKSRRDGLSCREKIRIQIPANGIATVIQHDITLPRG